MSTSENPDPNDPYFIASVPTYVENLGVDNDDTIGDGFFDVLSLSPSPAPPPRPQQLVRAKDGPTSQRASTGPVLRPPSRAGDIPPKEPIFLDGPVPKVKAQPRLIRRSMMANMKLNTDTGPAMAEQKQNEMEMHEPVVEVEVKDNNKQHVPDVTTTPRITRSSVFQNSKPMTRSMAANLKQTDKDTSVSASSIANKTVVQPPMRFNNVNARQSVLQTGTPTVGRANAGGISHGVCGISVHRTPSRLGDIEQKEPVQKPMDNDGPVSKVQAKPRPLRRSVMENAGAKPMMTRSASAETRSTSTTELNKQGANEQKQQGEMMGKGKVPAVAAQAQATPRPIRGSVFQSSKPTTRSDSKQKDFRPSTSTSSKVNKPALIQPPMRFGNAPTTRRSVLMKKE